MEETVEYKEEYLERSHWVRAKKWVKEKVEKTSKFFTDNPMLIMPILSGVGMILGGIVRAAANSGDGNDRCLVEDDVTGEDFRTKHPLTNAEILELGERMNDGQRKGEALNDMGVLKNERRRR